VGVRPHLIEDQHQVFQKVVPVGIAEEVDNSLGHKTMHTSDRQQRLKVSLVASQLRCVLSQGREEEWIYWCVNVSIPPGVRTALQRAKRQMRPKERQAFTILLVCGYVGTRYRGTLTITCLRSLGMLVVTTFPIPCGDDGSISSQEGIVSGVAFFQDPREECVAKYSKIYSIMHLSIVGVDSMGHRGKWRRGKYGIWGEHGDHVVTLHWSLVNKSRGHINNHMTHKVPIRATARFSFVVAAPDESICPNTFVLCCRY